MNWNSWSDFFAMGGYGLYVWGSLIVTFVFLLGEVLQLRWRTQALRDEIIWSHRSLTSPDKDRP